jgi:UDP-glucose 4-epimerase
MRKILITGGAGYIGSHVAELLIKKKYDIFIIDNLRTGYKKLINRNAKFFKIDLKEEKKIRNLILKHSIDSVIHLAALLDVNESQKKPTKYFKNNVIGTKNLLKACLNSKVKNFIFSSTAAVYKDGIFRVNERSPTKPKSNYGKGKLKTEKLIKSTLKDTNINYAILRYFNVCGSSKSNKFGQINSYDLLFKNLAKNSLTKKPYINIYGNDYKTKDGTCIRDFIHISDLADIHFKILKKIHKNGKSILINCGYGTGKSVLEVVKAFQKIQRKKIEVIYKPRRRADLSQIVANNFKLKKFLRWRPSYNNLNIMVKSSLRWEKKLR